MGSLKSQNWDSTWAEFLTSTGIAKGTLWTESYAILLHFTTLSWFKHIFWHFFNLCVIGESFYLQTLPGELPGTLRDSVLWQEKRLKKLSVRQKQKASLILPKLAKRLRFGWFKKKRNFIIHFDSQTSSDSSQNTMYFHSGFTKRLRKILIFPTRLKETRADTALTMAYSESFRKF